MDPMNRFSLYRTFQARPIYNQTNRMKPWEPPPLIKNKVARHILITLALGAGGALVTMSPLGAVYFMIHGSIILALKDMDYKREMKKLEKKGYTALTKTPEGFVVKLLKKSTKRLQTILIEDVVLPISHKWDGKWRLYFFDIPEKHRAARDYLRRKLKDLGMFNVQRSVFVYPYDCRQELDLISDYYQVSEYGSYAEISYSDIDGELRRFFKLNRVK